LSKDPRTLAAILRSPVPMPMYDEVAKATWKEQVEATSPHMAALKDHRAAREWMRIVVPQVEERLKQM
jgi:hypothetical protein